MSWCEKLECKNYDLECNRNCILPGYLYALCFEKDKKEGDIMSINCKNCLHYRSGVGCESGIKCMNFDLYKEVRNLVQEEKKYNLCYNKKCTNYDWKTCSCMRSENRYNDCKYKVVKIIEKEIETIANNIVPRYYHKGKVDTIEFSLENNLSFIQGNIVKYVVRYKEKNGLEDLKKAMEYLKRLIQCEEGNK